MTDSTPVIALFGGSGATGSNIIEQALVRGYRINTLVRNRSSLQLQHDHLHVVVGSFNDSDALNEVIMGADAVICVIGPRPPYTDTFCAPATRAIITCMANQRVKRLICQTGAMIGEYDQNRTLLFKWMTRAVHKQYPAMVADRAEQERLIKESDLDWTIIKPSRLTQGGARGRVTAGTDLRMGLLSKISCVDLASFLLDQMASNEYTKRAVFVR